MSIGVVFAEADSNLSNSLLAEHQQPAKVQSDLVNFVVTQRRLSELAVRFVASGRQADAGDIYLDLGERSQVHGSFAAAEVAFKRGIELLKHYAPPNDLRNAIALDDLAWLYATWGRFDEASRLMDQAQMKADGVQPNATGQIRHLDMQAAFLVVVGKYSEAEKDWNRALEIGKLRYGPDSPEYDNIFVHFGQASSIFGDYTVAEQMFQRYLAIEKANHSDTELSQAVVAGELGKVYTQLHKYSEAENWFSIARNAVNRNPDAAPLVRSMLLSYMGDYYMKQENWSAAQAQYRESLRIQQSVLGDSSSVAGAMLALSNALKKLHLKQEAKDLMAHAKAILSAQRERAQRATVDIKELQRH